MSRKIIIYGVALAFILICLKVLQYKLVIIDDTFELYAGVVAIIFTGLGIILGKRHADKPAATPALTIAPAAIIPVVPVPEINKNIIDRTGISKREHEILRLMAEGYSNQQIADAAFVSVSTVKTHISNLFVKLDVGRRTQAVKKAKELNLID